MGFRRDALSSPWHGVSLGGWLLLEPGPSYPLFAHHPAQDGEEARCEWDLMKQLRQKLGKKRSVEVLKVHRDTHITKADFERIRACGLNAVRLPFGYWVVTEPRANEPYIGSALEYVDRAVDWAEECGLQIVLDLHGCPGSESSEAPCGRRQRPASRWNWRHWDMARTLQILDMLAKRYSSRRCVTGIAVCNEPSGSVPCASLLRYYSQAVDRIRKAGMPASRVAVVLPVFQRPEGEVAFMKKWWSMTRGRHRNVCFDAHCYHCFENEFNGKSLAQQLRAVEENAKFLREYPVVVGEWSLALGVATWCTAGEMGEDEIISIFGAQQLGALQEASHGSFFWTWKECPENKEWNFQQAFSTGLLSRLPRQLPDWDGKGEDPLEEELHPSPSEPRVFYGDTVYLRVFHGRYVDVEGAKVCARWADKAKFQSLTFCPSDSASASPFVRREVRHRDIVRLRAHNGRYISVEGTSVTASRSCRSTAGEFQVCLEGEQTLVHRGIAYLRSRSTSMSLDADEDQEGVYARFKDLGLWQAFSVEKDVEVPSSSSSSNKVRQVPKSASLANSLQIDIQLSKELLANVSSTGNTKRSAAASKQAHIPKNLKRRSPSPGEVAMQGVTMALAGGGLRANMGPSGSPAKLARLR